MLGIMPFLFLVEERWVVGWRVLVRLPEPRARVFRIDILRRIDISDALYSVSPYELSYDNERSLHLFSVPVIMELLWTDNRIFNIRNRSRGCSRLWSSQEP